MPAFTDRAENLLIDWLFRGQAAPVLPAAWHFALLTQLPGDDGNALVEVAGPGYARVPMARSLAVFAGTQGLGSTLVSAGASGLTTNNTPVRFPQPGGDWGTVRGMAVFDAPQGGNAWICGALTEPRLITAGQAAPSFDTGAFAFALDAA